MAELAKAALVSELEIVDVVVLEEVVAIVVGVAVLATRNLNTWKQEPRKIQLTMWRVHACVRVHAHACACACV